MKEQERLKTIMADIENRDNIINSSFSFKYQNIGKSKLSEGASPSTIRRQRTQFKETKPWSDVIIEDAVRKYGA